MIARQAGQEPGDFRLGPGDQLALEVDRLVAGVALDACLEDAADIRCAEAGGDLGIERAVTIRGLPAGIPLAVASTNVVAL